MEGFMFSTPMIISPVDVEHSMADVDDMMESSIARDLFIREPILEPYEGMEFESEEASREFYHTYAAQMGFKARVSSFIRSKRDKSIISRQLVCSREGFRSMKDANHEGKSKRPRMITRVGCRAMIMVKKQSTGRWVVSKCEKVHNHVLGTQGKVVMLDFDPYTREDEVTENPSCKGSTLTSGVVGSSRGMEVMPEADPHLEPYEGMEFESELDAQAFYKDYARCVGFRARVSSYYRSKRDNSIISRLIVCSKEGFRAKKDDGSEESLQRPRAVTRVGCKGMIMVKKRASGKWVVSKVVKHHNHPLTPRTASDSERCESEEEEMLEIEKAMNTLGDSISEPYEGMQFDSEDAARIFYHSYSRRVGFNMRVSTYYRSKRDKSIISRLFVCSKEGFYMKKDSSNDGKMKRLREATRVGCKAMLMVKKNSSGKWVISKFEKEHNHPLGSRRKMRRMRKRKHTFSNVKDQNELQYSDQESPTSQYNNLCHEAIKYAEAGTASTDVYNVAMQALREAVKKVTSIKNNGAPNLDMLLNDEDLEDDSNQNNECEDVLPFSQQPKIKTQHSIFQPKLSRDSPLRKFRICNVCKQTGDHSGRTCPITQLNLIASAPVNLLSSESINELFQQTD